MKFFSIFIVAAVSFCAVSSVAQTNPPAALTKKELKEYSRIQRILYPKKPDIYGKVVELFGDHPTYTADQVTAATDPTVKIPFNYDQRRKENRDGQPIDSFSKQQTQELLASYSRLHPKATNLWESLVSNYGDKPWYRADELRDVEESGKGGRKMDGERPPEDPVEQQIMAAEMRPLTFGEEIGLPRIRQNWRDVLYDEDRSQNDNQSKAIKDLVGATFSYAHDGKARTDTWTINGAVLWPWEHDFALTGGLTPARVAVAPSVSINRLDTNGDPKKETDSLLFRLGFYGDWIFNPSSPMGVQIRAAGVYATDTGFRGSLPGAEVDLEPRWVGRALPLGYKKVLIRKEPLLDDETDKSCLDFQLRAWLHMEGGDVQDNGKSWDNTKGGFFRLGPTVQMQLNAPRLVWGKDFSITALYSYLGAISGSDHHNSYWKVSGVLDLFKDDLTNHKVSFTTDYQKGGLNFTKEDVDTVTVGLGVLF